MGNGWLKMHRRFLEWEWFDDAYMVKLFLYLLLKANHQDGTWKGNVVKRGQLIIGLNSLSKVLNMSVKMVRNRLKKLSKTGEIFVKTGNQFSLATICNYDEYQVEESKKGNQRAIKGQSKGNKQECKECKELKTFCANEESFALFWDAFADKRGRASALKVWDKIKLNDELLKQIINGAKSYAKIRPGMKANNQTPKMAQGWLTDQRWEDEECKQVDKPFQQDPRGFCK